MNSETSSGLAPVGERDHVIGSEQPQLTLVEYGDFGCPHCFAAKLPLESLLRRFDGLRLVWRHFPDPALHPDADLGAELSELGSAYGKFWEAHSRLLAGRESFSTEGLIATAGALELDEAEAESALRDRRYRPRVEVDLGQAVLGPLRASRSAAATSAANLRS